MLHCSHHGNRPCAAPSRGLGPVIFDPSRGGRGRKREGGEGRGGEEREGGEGMVGPLPLPLPANKEKLNTYTSHLGIILVRVCNSSHMTPYMTVFRLFSFSTQPTVVRCTQYTFLHKNS